MTSKLDKETYLLTELPAILNVTYLTCHSYIKTKRLKGYQINGRWYVKQEDLKNFLKAKCNIEESFTKNGLNKELTLKNVI